MKYDEYFKEPQVFNDGSIIFHGDWTKEKCIEKARELLNVDLVDTMIERAMVRFGFPPEFVQDHDEFDGACWYTGASDKPGSKEVWRIRKC